MCWIPFKLELLVSMLCSLTGVLRNEEGVPELEENFDEAVRNLNTSLVPTRVGYIFIHFVKGPS